MRARARAPSRADISRNMILNELAHSNESRHIDLDRARAQGKKRKRKSYLKLVAEDEVV